VCAGRPQGEARKRRVKRRQVRSRTFQPIKCLYCDVFWQTFALMTNSEATPDQSEHLAATPATPPPLREVGGREGPEPTRFGDWELRGRCIDF
jgi:hypothetical protein